MDLYETLTHDVCRSAIEHYEVMFWVLAPKNLGPQNYLFLTTVQLNSKFEGQYLWRGT